MKTEDYSDLIAQYTEALINYHEIDCFCYLDVKKPKE